MRKSLVQQAAAEYSKRSRTKRTRAHGHCRYPPSLAHGADRPPATGAAAFSDDAKKGEGGTRSAQALPLEKRGVPLSRQSLGFRTIPPSRVCAVPRAGNAPANDAPA